MKIKNIFSLALPCLVFCGTTTAQNSDSLNLQKAEVEIREVVIHANRLQFMEKKVPKNITVISQKEIKNSPAQSFAELLSYQSAVDLRQRGAMGVQADLGINGGNYSQSQLLINGIKMNDPQTAHHLMNLFIPLQFVEQIEVIKGGAAKRYGQNAFSGAVNIHTKIPENNSLYLSLLGGDYALLDGTIAAAFGGEKYRQILAINHSQSDGYRHNTDFSMSNFFYQGKYRIAQGESMGLLLGFSDRAFGANGFYASAEAREQYEEIQTAVANLSYDKIMEKWKLSASFSWRSNHDQYDYIKHQPLNYRNTHQTNTYSAELNLVNDNKMGQSAFGLAYRRENIFGDEIRSKRLSKSRLNGKYRDNIGFYAEHKLSFFDEMLLLSPGFYAAWYSDFGEQFFPAIDLAVMLNEDFNLFTSLGRSFRIPAFYDQYYDSPLEKGNPNLKPEKATTWESGIRFQKDGWRAKAVYLYRNAYQVIDWVKKKQNTFWSAANHAALKSNAVDLLVAYRKPEKTKRFSLSGLSLSYFALDQFKRSSELPSRYVLDYLKSQFIAKLHLNLFEKAELNLVYRNLQRISADPYQLFDLRMAYQYRKTAFFIDINNLLDTDYVEVMTKMPGRWFKIGINSKINL